MDEDEFAACPDGRVSQAPQKGRGTMTRIPHRFHQVQREAVLDEWAQVAAPDEAQAVQLRTSVTPEQARTILSRNDSPDIPFTSSINPYRGCEHGCIYCYARPTHSYLNLSPGVAFETQLVAKVNAAERLRAELMRPGYEASPINLGAATDPYQPIDRQWAISRGVLEVLCACRHPFTIVTKSSGVERDLDLLRAAASRGQTYVMVSVTTLDADLCRRLEPRAAAPMRRLETVRRLSQAGVPVGVNVAPIIPFLNEPEIERIVEAAGQAGAQSVHYTVLRLPWEVKPLFEEWLGHHVPEKAERILARLREMRGGKAYDADYRLRMKGEGVWAQLIAQRMRKAAARHGLNRAAPQLDVSAFEPALLHVDEGPQQALF
ncbi:MAG: PA0069 family radical SAM protein [Aquabacterium sp.]